MSDAPLTLGSPPSDQPNPDPTLTPPADLTTTPGGDGPDPTAPPPSAETPPTPEQQAEAARAVVPEAAEGYALNVPEAAKAYVPDAENDAAMKGLRDYAKTKGWSQGQLDDVVGVIGHFAESGVLQPLFDPAAELTSLGENGKARQGEVLTFAESLKSRGDITDAEYAELASLAPTAAGVGLIEKLRGWMGERGVIAPSGGDGGDPKVKAQEMADDPRYRTDPMFRRQADDAWKKAYTA